MRSSTLETPKSPRKGSNAFASRSFGRLFFHFLSSRSRRRRPISTDFSFSAVWMWARILFFARAVSTKLSQSREGCEEGDVRISTMSPFTSGVLRGTSRPFTRAPVVWWPTSVWTRYAKSTGVAPRGNAKTAPFGLKM